MRRPPLAAPVLLIASALIAPAHACATDHPNPVGTTSVPPMGRLEGAPTDLPDVVEVSISGFSFSPAVAILSPGQTIRFTNFDSIDHTATAQTGPGSLQPSGAFDTGSLLYLESRDVAAPAIGVYAYYCQPHGSSMQGTVEVRGAGDVNGDRSANFDDLLVLAANYNQSPRTFAEGDVNVDGQVNFDDLLVLAAEYNRSYSNAAAWSLAVAVPEPTLPALSLIAGLGLLARRRSEGGPRE